MDISTSLVYFYVLMILFATELVGKCISYNRISVTVMILSIFMYQGSPCNDERPCKQGFMCSPDHLCKASDSLVPKSEPELDQVENFKNWGISSLRFRRKVKPLDEDSKCNHN